MTESRTSELERLGEALFILSDRLRKIGALDSDNVHAAYEKVVAEFQALDALTLLREEAWQGIETAPDDEQRYLFITRKGIQRVDRYHPHQLSGRRLRWQEKPNDPYIAWQMLPDAPRSLKDRSNHD